MMFQMMSVSNDVTESNDFLCEKLRKFQGFELIYFQPNSNIVPPLCEKCTFNIFSCFSLSL